MFSYVFRVVRVVSLGLYGIKVYRLVIVLYYYFFFSYRRFWEGKWLVSFIIEFW